MKIKNILNILKIQSLLNRTPSGRLLNQEGVESINACLSDFKNHDADAIKCLNCGFIGSRLLILKGCPNCNGLDMTLLISKEDLL